MTAAGGGGKLIGVQLTMEASQHGQTAVVKCRGRLVFGDEEDEFRALILLLLKETSHVALDFSGITHIDSAGIGALVGVLISAKNRHSTVSLVALPPNVRKVLEISRLLELFPQYPTKEQALAAKVPSK